MPEGRDTPSGIGRLDVCLVTSSNSEMSESPRLRAARNLLRSASMNQTGPRESVLHEASECRVDRDCDCLSIHTSGTDPFVRSRARGAAGQRHVAPRAAQLLDLVPVIA
jgi:hypothetical protein